MLQGVGNSAAPFAVAFSRWVWSWTGSQILWVFFVGWLLVFVHFFFFFLFVCFNFVGHGLWFWFGYFLHLLLHLRPRIYYIIQPPFLFYILLKYLSVFGALWHVESKITIITMIPVEFEVCTIYASRGLNPWRVYFLRQQELWDIQLLICTQDQSLICMVK